MRFLVRAYQESTLRRGYAIEQFLGCTSEGDPTVITMIELRPKDGAFQVWVHEHWDIGDETFIEVAEFPYTDPDGPDGPHATFDSPVGAIEYSEAVLGAIGSRWTNEGVSESEYLDFVRLGRPDKWPPVGV